MKRAARILLGFVGGAVYLIVLSPSLQAKDDGCKPDVSTVDKITKQQQDVWTQGIAVTSAGAAFMGSKQVSMAIGIGRFGGSSAVTLEIVKVEESTVSASFDSGLRAVKGNRFFLGFKDGGEPLSFVATEVANETKARNEILDMGRGKIVSSVFVSSTVSDQALAAMRTALTTRQIDAIRLKMAGDLTFETSLDEKTGKKVLGKFSCFYDSMDRIVALAKDPSMSAARGRYLRQGKPADFLELNPDGTWSIFQNGKSVRGNYKVEGEALSLMSPKMKMMGRETFVGNTIKDQGGIIWEKQAETPKTESSKADTTVTLRLGMTPEQVEAAQGGKPQKVIDLGSKKTYVYPDMKIIFVDGKVTDIQ